MSEKNTSFQLAGLPETRPFRAMKSAKTMTFFGVIVHSFSGFDHLHSIAERGEQGLDHHGVLIVVARRRPDDVEDMGAA
jgi:orotidine-5'-phosphate decarboxylase